MSFTELCVLLVVRHKVMTLSEFYNSDIFDLDFLISHLDEVERDAQERMRMMMWAALAPYSKEQKSPEDIIKFKWETDATAVTTKEQFENMFGKYKKLKKYGK